MPIHNRASWARLKVGILAIFAMSILAALIFLITGQTSLFETQVQIYTYMADAAALTNGAPVNLDGIPIGKVSAIRLSGSKNPNRLVRIDMQVPRRDLKDIPNNSQASISAANVLGTKYINIKSGTSTTPVEAGGEIPSVPTGEIQDLVQQGFGVMASLQDTIERVNKIVGLVENGQGSIGKLLVDDTLYNHFLQVVDAANQLVNTFNSDKGTVGLLLNNRELYDNFQKTLSRVDDIIQQIENGQGTAGKVLKDPALYNEAEDTLKGLHTMVDDLNAGKGTAGQILKSDQLSNQLKATIAKIDTLIDKINSGQGTIGQLLVNPQLYDSLNGASRQLNLLMQDFRANPKKFLRIRLSIF